MFGVVGAAIGSSASGASALGGELLVDPDEVLASVAAMSAGSSLSAMSSRSPPRSTSSRWAASAPKAALARVHAPKSRRSTFQSGERLAEAQELARVEADGDADPQARGELDGEGLGGRRGRRCPDHHRDDPGIRSDGLGLDLPAHAVEGADADALALCEGDDAEAAGAPAGDRLAGAELICEVGHRPEVMQPGRALQDGYGVAPHADRGTSRPLVSRTPRDDAPAPRRGLRCRGEGRPAPAAGPALSAGDLEAGAGPPARGGVVEEAEALDASWWGIRGATGPEGQIGSAGIRALVREVRATTRSGR